MSGSFFWIFTWHLVGQNIPDGSYGVFDISNFLLPTPFHVSLIFLLAAIFFWCNYRAMQVAGAAGSA